MQDLKVDVGMSSQKPGESASIEELTDGRDVRQQTQQILNIAGLLKCDSLVTELLTK